MGQEHHLFITAYRQYLQKENAYMCYSITANTECHSPKVSKALNDLQIFFSNSMVDWKVDSKLTDYLYPSFNLHFW